MSRIHSVFLAVTAGSVLICAGCGKHTSSIDPAKLTKFAALTEPARPRPGEPMAARVDLGRMLYYEVRLSKSQRVSCNSCHPLAMHGVDGATTSTGYRGQRGLRNSPTVYNAALQFAQFWDGRAPDVEVQAGGPLLNPAEMAMPSEKAVADVVASMPGYVTAFRRAFPGESKPVTFRHITEAIGAFERGLVTPARWDAFLQGLQAMLSTEEKSGFNHFVAAGCDNCHAGALVGGSGFQKLGLAKEYADRRDPGRYRVTSNQSDRMFFKIASLRNVAMTGPYFHNGAVERLEDAVTQMAEYQTGRYLAAHERDEIVAWLKTLTGVIDANYVKPPELPKSTAATPRPS
jgi:cytochrome c peroxidase